MCGIHGFIDHKNSKEKNLSTIHKMVESTNHRGPDYSETNEQHPAYFGHNRLKIIDLSEASNQPMHCDNLTIVFNGEIYNYKELKSELIAKGLEFKTDSDTEVILKSFQFWGEACVTHFIGMWAFAIWNSLDQTLFCSRDRFGIKPFYFVHEGSQFYFASEVKSLKHSPCFSKNLNLNQVSRGLQLGWISYQNETFFEVIQQLRPGFNMWFKDGKISHNEYWKLNALDKINFDSRNDAYEEFEHLFMDSLSLHLRSDVPIGATLSGGIDSSAIVCSLIKEFGINNLSTFSIYYEGKDMVDERPFIHEIEKKYAGNFTPNYYSPKIEDIENEISTITHHCDFPMLGSSPISQYFIMKEIAKTPIKVVLSGQGADDYLGGYQHTHYRQYAEMFRKFKLLNVMRELKFQKKFQNFNSMDLTKVMLKSVLSSFLNENSLYNLEYKKYYPHVVNLDTKNVISLNSFGSNKVSDFHYHLLKHSSLPTLLHYEDRNSMAFSLESRVPFLDHRLVEFAFKIDSDYKIKDGVTKQILREAMKNVLPEKIKDRRDKKGFVTPGEIVWLRGELSHFLDINYSELPFLNAEKCKRLIDEFKKGDNSNAQLIWRLSSLNFWMGQQ